MAVPLTHYESMDPFILLSAVNMVLRDEGISLEELCQREEVDKALLSKKLEAAGFTYDSTQRQFK